MKLLPRETFSIYTSDAIDSVIQKLSAQVEAPKALRFSRRHRPYEGSVSDTGFKIKRIIHYRNSFLPEIIGSFEPHPGGTYISIKMRPNPILIPFVGLWFLVWYGALIPFAIPSANIPAYLVWLFILAPIPGWLLVLIFFWREVDRSRRDLLEIVGGSIVRSQ